MYHLFYLSLASDCNSSIFPVRSTSSCRFALSFFKRFSLRCAAVFLHPSFFFFPLRMAGGRSGGSLLPCHITESLSSSLVALCTKFLLISHYTMHTRDQAQESDRRGRKLKVSATPQKNKKTLMKNPRSPLARRRCISMS